MIGLSKLLDLGFLLIAEGLEVGPNIHQEVQCMRAGVNLLIELESLEDRHVLLLSVAHLLHLSFEGFQVLYCFHYYSEWLDRVL